MGKSDQQSTVSLSISTLLAELEELVTLEAQKSGSPWIERDRLNQLFYAKHGISLIAAANLKDSIDGVSTLLTRSQRFAVYRTQVPHEFYVAPLQMVVPGHPSQPVPIQYTVKRPWKVDGRLLQMLRMEGAEEILPCSPQPNPYSPQPNLSPPCLSLTAITSVQDLEIALTELIRLGTADSAPEGMTIATLSQLFHSSYQQSIRTVMRHFCSDLKLIEFLQMIPALQVQRVNADGRVTIKVKDPVKVLDPDNVQDSELSPLID